MCNTRGMFCSTTWGRGQFVGTPSHRLLRASRTSPRANLSEALVRKAINGSSYLIYAWRALTSYCRDPTLTCCKITTVHTLMHVHDSGGRKGWGFVCMRRGGRQRAHDAQKAQIITIATMKTDVSKVNIRNISVRPSSLLAISTCISICISEIVVADVAAGCCTFEGATDGMAAGRTFGNAGATVGASEGHPCGLFCKHFIFQNW